jgi:hypothetical protein
MDPDATLQVALDAIRDLTHNVGTEHHDRMLRDDAITALRDLADWLERGGFPPRDPR